MEGCSKSKMSAGVTSGLPDDPLVEILSRLPAKSVCRFKCVSKAWRGLIAHPDHRKKLRQPMQGLFVQATEAFKVGNTRSFRRSYSFIDLTMRSVPLDIDPSFSFLKEVTGIKTFLFLDSCNGLILFRHLPGGYIVCNPTTKQWSVVPACDCSFREASNYTYLAFDPAVSSHFRLLQFRMRHIDEEIASVHVYSSETGTWGQNQLLQQGQLGGWHYQYTPQFFDYHCAFVNGFLHMMVWGSHAQHILAVDIQGKARRMITVPGIADGIQMHGSTCYLGQSQGQLHCVTRECVKKKLSTWVLQDYDTQEWVLKNTVDTFDVFGETEDMPKFDVVDMHQDCNVVFFFHRLGCDCNLIAYNMDSKEASVIATFEDHKSRSDFARYIPYFSESPALTKSTESVV